VETEGELTVGGLLTLDTESVSTTPFDSIFAIDLLSFFFRVNEFTLAF